MQISSQNFQTHKMFYQFNLEETLFWRFASFWLSGLTAVVLGFPLHHHSKDSFRLNPLFLLFRLIPQVAHVLPE